MASLGIDDYLAAADTSFEGLLEQLPGLDAADRLLFREHGEGKGKGGKRGNWVSQTGGLPKLIRRVADHLMEKAMDESRAIATAVNVVKRYCANHDLNFPGKQNIKASTIAKGCAAVAEWNAKRARARAT